MFTALCVGVGARPEALEEDRSGSAVRSCSRTPFSLRLCEGLGIDLSTTMLFSVSIIPFFFCRGALIQEFASVCTLWLGTVNPNCSSISLSSNRF